MREIILDTETTGLDPRSGHRIVEIGGIEILDGFPTGRSFHHYLNPERAMPPDAFAIHGLSDGFLRDKPVFSAVAKEFLDFIEGARLVIHNASFDMTFINAELARLSLPPIPDSQVVDTLQLARRKHPGQSNSLDALCQRYGVDNSRRTKHGALMDAEILAEVYAELTGGRQQAFSLERKTEKPAIGSRVVEARSRQPAPSLLSEAEKTAHAALVAELGGNALWNGYLGRDPDRATADAVKTAP